jgi:hypothetical protein
MSDPALSAGDAEDAAATAVVEASRNASRATAAEYPDLLVKKGYLQKTAKEDYYKPAKKFTHAWADATLVVVRRSYPDPPPDDPDPRATIALEMARVALGLDRKAVKVRPPEEMVRLATAIFNVAKEYFKDPAFLRKVLESERGFG